MKANRLSTIQIRVSANVIADSEDVRFLKLVTVRRNLKSDFFYYATIRIYDWMKIHDRVRTLSFTEEVQYNTMWEQRFRIPKSKLKAATWWITGYNFHFLAKHDSGHVYIACV